MALTATQRTDFQGDIGIGSDEAVFTNAELDRLYARSDSDYNGAVYLAWRQLMADAAKFNDYTAGQTQEKKSQVYDHIKDMVEFWKDEARVATNQVRLIGLLEVPPRDKDTPDA
jgi:hypothetical protein